MTRLVILIALALAALGGCAHKQTAPGTTHDAIVDELRRAAPPRAAAPRPQAVDQALLAPAPAPVAPAPAPEPRFDLAVSNASAQQVFLAIVSGTKYSMLVHPEVSGTVSVNLKDVTVREALDTLRDLYGYDYRVQGSRIMVQPNTLQTRVFQVNYLSGKRQGSTDVLVSSGSIVNSAASGNGTTSPLPGAVPVGPATTQSSVQSARVRTSSDADFWAEVKEALTAILGGAEGRKVIINAHSGVILVRGLPAELRSVEQYLRATQLVIERQVMLEAKIVEVQLRDGFESGVNWALFRTNGNSRASGGVIAPGTVLQNTGPLATGAAAIDSAARTFTDPLLEALPGADLVTSPRGANGLFGLAFQSKHFAAILQFLETQGDVQVLSSPRIATVNNQKAVLKVGTDEFFVTNVSTTTNSSGSTTTSSPTITVQPFFSGISLDVTPQIDDADAIILHVHPSISSVAEKTKNIDLGDLGTFRLPLASSTINESDSVVRVLDGQIVAIGGLMTQQQQYDSQQVPGLGNVPVVGQLFSQRQKSYAKRELVILIKPTVIRGDRARADLDDIEGRLQSFDPRRTQPDARAE